MKDPGNMSATGASASAVQHEPRQSGWGGIGEASMRAMLAAYEVNVLILNDQIKEIEDNNDRIRAIRERKTYIRNLALGYKDDTKKHVPEGSFDPSVTVNGEVLVDDSDLPNKLYENVMVPSGSKRVRRGGRGGPRYRTETTFTTERRQVLTKAYLEGVIDGYDNAISVYQDRNKLLMIKLQIPLGNMQMMLNLAIQANQKDFETSKDIVQKI